MGTRQTDGWHSHTTIGFTEMKIICFVIITLYVSLAHAEMQFSRVTEKAGIQFQHFNGATGEKHLVETMGGGAAFFDYNNDDYLDIYLVNGAPLTEKTADVLPTNYLYRNNGDGTFTDATLDTETGDTGYGIGCCIGDYNNDGNRDLFITNFGHNVLYRNNGDGSFADVSQQSGIAGESLFSAGCAFADYNNDGWLDLIVVNYVMLNLDDAPDCSQDGIPAYCRPEDFPPAPDYLYKNNGDGTFTDVTQEAGITLHGRGLGVVWTDTDNDGWLDLYIANDRDANFLYHNNGDGTFTELGELHGIARNEHGDAESSMGIDTADYDNDGDLDLILTHYQAETNTLYQNDGNGVYWDMTAQCRLGEPTLLPLAWGTNFGDFDNDGWVDIFFAIGHLHDNIEKFEEVGNYKQPNQVLFNQGNGLYRDISSICGEGLQIEKSSRGSVFGDYDNDGDLDILIMNIADTPDLLRNVTPTKNNWLSIKLIGQKSNRDAIGAKVTLHFGDTKRLIEVKSGGSYLSHSQFRLQVGLGTVEKVDRIVIKWQNGVQDVIKNVECNQRLTIEEGIGIISNNR